MTELSPHVDNPLVQAELQRVAQILIELNEHIWVEEFAEPSKPRQGMVRYADGTTWNPGSGAGMYLYNGATWNFLQGAGGSGETNTGSNQGTDGQGVFDNKVGVDLQFRHIAPASTKMSVALNGKDIDLDVNQGNLSIAIGQITGFTDNSTNWDTAFSWGDHSGLYSLLAHNHSGVYAPTAHTHLLAAGATDVTATASEVNLLDLAGLTVDWVLSADSATTASWKAQVGGGSEFLTISEFDDTDGTYYFYGGVDLAVDWKINRYDKTTFVKTSADEGNNGGYASLAAAWPDRLTLTYA